MEVLNLNERNDSQKEKLIINRPVYTQKQFENEFSIKAPLQTNQTKSIFQSIDPRRLINIFTIINLITEYDYKNDFIPDLMSGFTVGIMHIPQVSFILFKFFISSLILILEIGFSLWCSYFVASSAWILYLFLLWINLCYLWVNYTYYCGSSRL